MGMPFNGTTYYHLFELPQDFDNSVPRPIMFYTPGWGDGTNEGRNMFLSAVEQGFMVVSIQGMGGQGWYSWNGFGSTKSPGPEGPTCQEGVTNDYCETYTSCGDCADDCWWTTCQDSVAEVVDVYIYTLNNFCVDMRQIWAVGCSNGGMFTYTLAHDPRTRDLFAGIIPQVGLPHFGFNHGPGAVMSYFGMWGVNDPTVPPLTGPNDQNITV